MNEEKILLDYSKQLLDENLKKYKFNDDQETPRSNAPVAFQRITTMTDFEDLDDIPDEHIDSVKSPIRSMSPEPNPRKRFSPPESKVLSSIKLC